jgi:flagellar hook-basal body complex protein FliE
MQPVLPYGLTPPPVAGPIPFRAPPAQDKQFAEALRQALGEVQTLNRKSQSSIEDSLTGDDVTMIESFTALREADLALRLMIQIRNKLVDAYQEIQQLRM